MKKTWLYPCMFAAAAMLTATAAHAEPIQIPGMVYIPTEDVELLPAGAAGDGHAARRPVPGAPSVLWKRSNPPNVAAVLSIPDGVP